MLMFSSAAALTAAPLLKLGSAMMIYNLQAKASEQTYY